jgi:hypothetical protein
MKNAMVLGALVVLLGVTVACSDKGTPPGPTPRAAVASIALTPSATTVTVGDTARIVAVLKSVAGAVLTDRSVQWSTSEPATVTVSTTGLVTGVAEGGPVSISATSEGVTATAQITVRRRPVASIDLTPTDTAIMTGSTVELVATLRSDKGEVLTDRDLTWTSSTPAIATVSPKGIVTAVAVGGPVTISVTSEGVTASARVRITAPPAAALLYRWTFSEEGGPGTVFRDDVRGAQATLVRVGSLAGSALAGQVTLTGGSRNSADYIALPARLLRDRTDATIEVWATVHSLKSWGRVFDIGASTANNLFIAWSQGTSSNTDRTAFAVGGVENRADNRLAPFTIDLQHHIALAIDEGGGDGGKTRLTLYLDGALRGSFDTAYRLRDLIDDDFWLGRSHYGDETANASYNELRIHGVALDAAQVQQSFLGGPVRAAPPVSLKLVQPTGLGGVVRGVGVRFQLRAVGRDALGRQFPLVGVQWSTTNPSVATVDVTGTVHTHATGPVEISATDAGTTVRWATEVIRVRRLAVDPYLSTPSAGALWEVPVVLLEYHPTADAVSLDTLRAPGFGGADPMSLDSLATWTLKIAKRRKMMVEHGSQFHGYRETTAQPSLGYRVVEHIIVYDQIPPHPTKRHPTIAGNPRFENWHAVFEDLQLEPLIRSRGVRELWVTWSSFDGNYPVYKPGVYKVDDMRAGWESNMSSPTTGDISNSDRDPTDAPVLSHTYIIYGINFRRTQAEAVHNVGHQLEAMMSYVAGRQDGNDRLFWRDFVGQDAQRLFITGRAGWTHMPPNTTTDYDYLNASLVSSDIEDWRPDNGGQKKLVNVNTWGTLKYPWPGEAEFGQRVESQWYTYWFQNFPGRGNQIPHGARWMTNWWAFVGDWDAAITSGLGLHASAPAATVGDGGAYGYAARQLDARPVVHRGPPPR